MNRKPPQARRTLAPQPPPAALYASRYDPELGAAICRRLAAGESLRSICRTDPAMPTEKTVWNWARAHPPFRQMKQHAVSRARAASLAAQTARDAERAAAKAEARAARGGWTSNRSGYGQAVADRIVARLMGGESLTAICREDDVPSIGTVYNWLRAHPEFLARYRWAKAYGCEAAVDRSCLDLPWLGPRDSYVLMRRTVKAAERRAAKLAMKRYAEASGPVEVTMVVAEPGASVGRVVYGPGETYRLADPAR